MSVSTSILDAALSTETAIKNYLGGDEIKNKEAVHSSVYDLNADNWNKIVAGLAEIVMALKTSLTLTPTAPTSYPYSADFGELVLVEISEYSEINLPVTTAADVGKIVGVKNLSTSTYAIVINAAGDETIDGAGDITVTSACDCVVLVCVAVGVWAILHKYTVPPE